MGRNLSRLALLALLAATSLSACDRGNSGKRPGETSAQLAKSDHVPKEVGGIAGATPMEQRVAVLGLLNKRNGLVREIEMKPGESVRIGRAIVRLRACETTAPWEDPPETGAFVQLTVQDQRDDKWYRFFSGWLFRERPERNVIQHPIYDVFVRSCTMSWPGEVTVPADGATPPAGGAAAASTRSRAPQSPAPSAPAPATNGTPPAAPAAEEKAGDTAG